MESETRNLMEFNLTTDQSQKRIDSDYYVEGYATTFEPYVLYRDGGEDVYEQISRNAFNDASMDDVILQYDHAGRIFARQSNGTLGIEKDDKGLFIWADLSKTAESRSLYEDIKAGMITKMSWRFMVANEGRNYDPVTRTIHVNKVERVYDVSAVSIPANDQTAIAARSFVDGEKEKARMEKEARDKKIKALTLRLALMDKESHE